MSTIIPNGKSVTNLGRKGRRGTRVLPATTSVLTLGQGGPSRTPSANRLDPMQSVMRLPGGGDIRSTLIENSEGLFYDNLPS